AITLVARDTAEDFVIANLARRLHRVVATLGERDRLGAFLTEARTARLVIAGEEPNATPCGPDLAERFAAAEPMPEARGAAAHLPRAGGAPSHSREIPVAAVRASSLLRPGIIVCALCTASTEDDALVAGRVVTVHVPHATGKPSQSEARCLAAHAADAVRDLP